MTTNRMSRRESMLKGLPLVPDARPSTTPLIERSYSAPPASFKENHVHEAAAHEIIAIASQRNARMAESRLLSLIRPDSWNVLSIDDLHYQFRAKYKQNTDSQDPLELPVPGSNNCTALNARSPGPSPCTAVVFDKNICTSVACSSNARSGSHDYCRTCHTHFTELQAVVSDRIGAEQKERPVKNLVQNRENKTIKIAPGVSNMSVKPTSAVGLQSSSALKLCLPSPMQFHTQEVSQCLGPQFYHYLMTQITEAMASGLLSGRLLTRSTSFKLSGISNNSVRNVSKAKMRVERAIKALMEADGWTAKVEANWSANNHLKSVKYELSIPKHHRDCSGPHYNKAI